MLHPNTRSRSYMFQKESEAEPCGTTDIAGKCGNTGILESPRATVRFVAIARPSKEPSTQNPWQRPWRTCRAWWTPQIARRPAALRTAARRISRWGRLRSPRRSITLERYSRRNLSSRSSTTTSRLGSRKVSRDTSSSFFF